MQTLQTNTLLQGGRYKIIKTLGQGGFGITYLALQSGLEREVAVKEFFMKDFCERNVHNCHVTLGTAGMRLQVERFREKFIKEARNIAKLHHPNIVRIIDVFEENGTAYYVMEYVESGSLGKKLRLKGSLSMYVATRYIMQVAEAVGYIHQRKMNHLDIKPDNIMLSDEDNVVLIDFGLAKQYDATTGGQTSTTPVGISEGYAPMEQYKQGGVATFTPETDIYALGATFFKLLTGITPPSASDVLEEGIPVRELEKKGVDQKTIALISHAMEARKKDRLHSITEFMQGLSAEALSMKPTQNEATIIIGRNATEETTIITDQLPQKPQDEKLTFTVKGVSFDMIKVKAGTFTMGGTPEMEDPLIDEKPTHKVILTHNYYLGKTEVTQALWKAVMGKNPSYFNGDNKPVERVSWNDCQAFISKLNAATGKNFRLPTEAEWEYAARECKKSQGFQYSGSDKLSDVAWYWLNSNGKTHTVGTKQANELGIYDMSGNVWEWCQDWYDYSYDYNYVNSPQTDPQGPASGSCRVCRGGSWGNREWNCRSSGRSKYDPDQRYYFLGLRLCLSE